MNRIILPILLQHKDIEIQNNKFLINKENISKEEQALQKMVFDRFTIKPLDGFEDCGIVIEEKEQNTGKVINKTLVLNDNLSEENLYKIKAAIQENKINNAITQTREGNMMMNTSQQALLQQELNKTNVQVLPPNSIKTRYGVILSGLPLLMLYSLMSKKENQNMQLIKSKIARIRRRKKHNRNDEIELDENGVDKKTQNILFNETENHSLLGLIKKQIEEQFQELGNNETVETRQKIKTGAFDKILENIPTVKLGILSLIHHEMPEIKNSPVYQYFQNHIFTPSMEHNEHKIEHSLTIR